MEAPKKEKKKSKRSPETLSADKSDAIEEAIQEKEKKSKSKKGRKGASLPQIGMTRAILLRSIAAYLESNGFTKTASSLRTEAPVEVSNDKSSYINLEEILFKYIESSDRDRSIEGLLNDQDLNKDIIATHEVGHDSRVSDQMISRKRKKQKKNSDGSEQDWTKSEHNSKEIIDALGKSQTTFKVKEKELKNCSTESYDISNNKNTLKNLKYARDAVDHEELKFDVNHSDHTDTKDKKKKKSCPDLIREDPTKISFGLGSETLESFEKGSLSPKNLASSNTSRKKKHKKIFADNHVQCSDHIRDKVKELKFSGNYSTGAAPGEPNNNTKDEEQLIPEVSKQVIDMVHKKSMDTKECSLVDRESDKNKKKKQEKIASQSPNCESSDQFGDPIYVDDNKKCIPDCPTHVLKNCYSGYDNMDNAGKSKKRKKLAAEGACFVTGDDIAKEEPKDVTKSGVAQANGVTMKFQGTDTSIEDVDPQNKSKRRKTGNNKDNSNVLLELSNKTSAPDNITEADEQFSRKAANGNLNGTIDRTSSKEKIKEKHSSEATAANTFKRVKVDEIEFADERLQDNSYWAKDGAESGYGAKAQEVLGQVRGSNFRHEKTKKKKGSYRGGQIDLQSYSIKFNYSDAE